MSPEHTAWAHAPSLQGTHCPSEGHPTMFQQALSRSQDRLSSLLLQLLNSINKAIVDAGVSEGNQHDTHTQSQTAISVVLLKI